MEDPVASLPKGMRVLNRAPAGRLTEIDVLRMLAALSVIAIHTTSRYVTTLAAGYAWNQAVRYAVPLFVIMSGFLLENSEETRGGRPPASAWSRVKRLLPPYVVWTLIYTAFYAWLDPSAFAAEIAATPLGLVGALLKRLLLGTGSTHLYFVPVIVQMYLLFSILHGWMRWRTGLTLAVSLAISLHFQSADYLRIFGARLLPDGGYAYYGILFPDWIFYFVLGMYVRRRLDSLRSGLADRAGWLGLLWVASLAALLADGKITGTSATSLKPTVMAYATVSFLFFYALCVKFASRLERVSGFARWFADQSYAVYLGHVLIMHLLDMWGLTAAVHGGIRGIAGMGFLFVEVSAASTAFVWLLSMTPASTILGSARRHT